MRIFLYKILIELAHTLKALAYTLIALTHLNSTEKLHRLERGRLEQISLDGSGFYYKQFMYIIYNEPI